MTVQRAINWIQCDHFGRKFRIFGKNHLGPWLTVNFCWPNCYSRFIDLNAFYPNWPACRLTLNKHKMCIWSICHSVNPEICFIIFGPNVFQNIPKFDEKNLTANLIGQYTFSASRGQPKIWVYLDLAKTLHLVWQYFIPFAKFSLLNNQSGHTDWFIPFRLFV